MIVAHFKADKYPEIKLYAEYFEITSVYKRTLKYGYAEIDNAYVKSDKDNLGYKFYMRHSIIEAILGRDEYFSLYINTKSGAQWDFDIPDPKNEQFLEVVNFLIERIEAS